MHEPDAGRTQLDEMGFAGGNGYLDTRRVANDEPSLLVNPLDRALREPRAHAVDHANPEASQTGMRIELVYERGESIARPPIVERCELSEERIKHGLDGRSLLGDKIGNVGRAVLPSHVRTLARRQHVHAHTDAQPSPLRLKRYAAQFRRS